MKLRIAADGELTGTQVFTEDGANISRSIGAVRFEHRAGHLPRAEIDIVFATAAALADATIFHAMPGGERKAIRRIEYVDGTVFDLSEPTAPE